MTTGRSHYCNYDAIAPLSFMCVCVYMHGRRQYVPGERAEEGKRTNKEKKRTQHIYGYGLKRRKKKNREKKVTFTHVHILRV